MGMNTLWFITILARLSADTTEAQLRSPSQLTWQNIKAGESHEYGNHQFARQLAKFSSFPYLQKLKQAWLLAHECCVQITGTVSVTTHAC